MYKLFVVIFLTFLFLTPIVKAQDILTNTSNSNDSAPQIEKDLLNIINTNIKKSLDYFAQGLSRDLKDYFTKKYQETFKMLEKINPLKTIIPKIPKLDLRFLST